MVEAVLRWMAGGNCEYRPAYRNEWVEWHPFAGGDGHGQDIFLQKVKDLIAGLKIFRKVALAWGGDHIKDNFTKCHVLL